MEVRQNVLIHARAAAQQVGHLPNALPCWLAEWAHAGWRGLLPETSLPACGQTQGWGSGKVLLQSLRGCSWVQWSFPGTSNVVRTPLQIGDRKIRASSQQQLISGLTVGAVCNGCSFVLDKKLILKCTIYNKLLMLRSCQRERICLSTGASNQTSTLALPREITKARRNVWPVLTNTKVCRSAAWASIREHSNLLPVNSHLLITEGRRTHLS